MDTIKLRRELKNGVVTGAEPVTSTWKLVSGQQVNIQGTYLDRQTFIHLTYLKEICEVYCNFIQLIKIRLPPILQKLSLYICNTRTEVVLFKPIVVCFNSYRHKRYLIRYFLSESLFPTKRMSNFLSLL
jgi:hypothetical protein